MESCSSWIKRSRRELRCPAQTDDGHTYIHTLILAIPQLLRILHKQAIKNNSNIKQSRRKAIEFRATYPITVSYTRVVNYQRQKHYPSSDHTGNSIHNKHVTGYEPNRKKKYFVPFLQTLYPSHFHHIMKHHSNPQVGVCLQSFRTTPKPTKKHTKVFIITVVVGIERA